MEKLSFWPMKNIRKSKSKNPFQVSEARILWFQVLQKWRWKIIAHKIFPISQKQTSVGEIMSNRTSASPAWFILLLEWNHAQVRSECKRTKIEHEQRKYLRESFVWSTFTEHYSCSIRISLHHRLSIQLSHPDLSLFFLNPFLTSLLPSSLPTRLEQSAYMKWEN